MAAAVTDSNWPDNVREIILAIAEKAGDEGAPLVDQVGKASVIKEKETPTWVYFSVPEGAEKVRWPDGVIPMRFNATIFDGSGQPTGIIYVWVEGGLLSAIEQPWYVDYPTGWPKPEQLVWDIE